MKTYTMANLITGETKERINVHTHAAACEYFDAIYPNLGANWLLVVVR